MSHGQIVLIMAFFAEDLCITTIAEAVSMDS